MNALANLSASSLAMMAAANNEMRGVVGPGLLEMIKAWTQPGGPTTGYAAYDLQAPAISLIPVETPWRNRIPRVGAKGGTQANWRATTALNPGKIAGVVDEGNRGGVIGHTEQDYFAAYRGIGYDDYVSYEAQYSAEEFMDILSRAQTHLLWATMLYEENLMVGGLGTYKLGTTNRPTCADIGTGGTLLPNTTYSVICVALTMEGYIAASVAGGIPGLVNRQNADQSTTQYGGGSAAQSQNRTQATANDGNATHCVSASTAVLQGAVAYAWFWGAAGAEVLGAITTINSVLITGNATGTQTAVSLGAADNSQNSLAFDGAISIASKAGMNSYILAQATGTAGTGTPLTADGDGGIVEFDNVLKWMWDNLRLSPSRISVSSTDQQNIHKKVLAGNSNGAQRFVFNSDQSKIVGGAMVVEYLNKFGRGAAKMLPIEPHPTLPSGTVIFDTDVLPYPLAGQSTVKQMKMRRDYYTESWPKVRRRWEYGVYADGVLQDYFPPATALITNIANG